MTTIELFGSSSFLFYLIPLLLLLCTTYTFFILSRNNSQNSELPKSYPVIGSLFSIIANRDRRYEWISNILRNSPTSTAVLHLPMGNHRIVTADPLTVQHILKTRFDNYEKGNSFRSTLTDLLGDGIFNVDGEKWKFQRQVSSYEFNTKSLRKFVEQVVDTELSDRLIPILSDAAKNNTVLDFQDILQRFTFDNICKIAFGYDPEYLVPSLPQAKFAVAFDEAVRLSTMRGFSLFPLSWKIKKLLDIGSERKLRLAVNVIREFARKIMDEKKKELEEKSVLESVDLLSRFLSSGHADEKFVIDIIISFVLAGRDTTSAALTWFFLLLAGNSRAESEILKEVDEKYSESSVYDEVKEMVYTHASISESMRLYPPVPIDTKEAINDDVLPDGTKVKKGTRVSYTPYAMGRMNKLWGENWREFMPERWLEKEASGTWKFVGKDAYAYSVFQAGPRICLGKEMAYLQMKRVIAGVLRRFKVVPMIKEGVEPVFVAYLTSRMEGGFPVQIVERN